MIRRHDPLETLWLPGTRDAPRKTRSSRTFVMIAAGGLNVRQDRHRRTALQPPRGWRRRASMGSLGRPALGYRRRSRRANTSEARSSSSALVSFNHGPPAIRFSAAEKLPKWGVTRYHSRTTDGNGHSACSRIPRGEQAGPIYTEAKMEQHGSGHDAPGQATGAL
jgi:hypothetical protein